LGTIRVAGTLNKESVELYNLTVQATDDGQLVGEASLSSIVRLRLCNKDFSKCLQHLCRR